MLCQQLVVYAEFAPQPQKIALDIKPQDVIHWQADSAHSFSDGSIEIGLRLQTEQNFTLYTTQVNFAAPEGYQLDHANLPTTQTLTDPVSGNEVQVYAGGDFILYFEGFKAYTAPTIKLAIRYLGCTGQICLFPYTQVIEIPNFYTNTPNPAKETPQIEAPQDLTLEEQLTRSINQKGISTWLLFLFVFLGGALTNLTPCVYPMIPITIRLLANQGKAPYKAACAYGLGIMLTYTTLGILAALSGAMFGNFMATAPVAGFFSLVMLGLALSMLGFGNLSKIQNIGYRFASKKNGLVNALLMGTGAGFIASPCTGPILASLLALSSSSNKAVESSLLMFIYSFGFAIPYVVLGTASAKLGQIKVSGTVQTIVKTFFAACMFGLSFYYLRILIYPWIKGVSAGQWFAASTLSLGLSVAIFTWVHKTKHESRFFLIFPALCLGLTFFFSYQALVKSSARKAQTELFWLYDEQKAFAKAKAKNIPLLIDVWADWCEACKKMDATTFSDDEIISLLKEKGWVLLKLDLTESSPRSSQIQEKYKIAGLPTLLFFSAHEVGNKIPAFETIAGYTSASALNTFIRER